MTPITVAGPLPVLSVMPSTSRPPRRLCQNSYDNTITVLLSAEIFFDGVGAAQRGPDAERGKYVGRHGQARHVRGLAVDDQDQIRRTHHSEVLEGPRPLAPGDEVGGGDHVAAGAAAIGLPDGDEAIRVAIWQRLQHHGAHDAEHGRGRADAERQRQERRRGEARRAPQHAKAMTNVAQRIPDDGWTARVMCTVWCGFHDVARCWMNQASIRLRRDVPRGNTLQ